MISECLANAEQLQSEWIANAIRALIFGQSKTLGAIRFRLRDHLRSSANVSETSANAERMLNYYWANDTNQERLGNFVNALHSQMAIRSSGTGP